MMQDMKDISPADKAAEKVQKGKYAFLFRFLIKTAVFVLIVFLLLTFVFKIFRMSGNTMYPYIQDGDLCIFYRLDDLYLNDVVIYEDDDGNECVGRVRATGGQVISFNENGGYTVDGYQPIEENPYETYAAGISKDETSDDTTSEAATADDESTDETSDADTASEVATADDADMTVGITYPLTLSGNEYFILNDFRQLTTDSREIGPIDRSRIKGKLIFVLRRRNF